MMTNPKTPDSKTDLRLYALYFGTLVAVYAGVIVFFRGTSSRDLAIGLIMFAPTAGALVASRLGSGVVRWGRPTWWVLAALLPAFAAFFAYLAGSYAGIITLDPVILTQSLSAAPAMVLTACLGAMGEEIGWRGFLWPLLRARYCFPVSSLIISTVWWLYHVPVILVGWYGNVAGIPAFTIALVGFAIFVGILTDRSSSLWPSIVAHGIWNGLVEHSFATPAGAHAFTGPVAWVGGEFGWLAALAMLILAVGAVVWHLLIPEGISTSPSSQRVQQADPSTLH